LDHCIHIGNVGDSDVGTGSNTSLSLERCSIINRWGDIDASIASMVPSVLIDTGSEGVVVLEMLHESGELGCLHAVSAGILAVMNACESIGDVVELTSQLCSFFIEGAVLEDFGNSGRVVESLNVFNESVVTAILASKKGKESESCSLYGCLSIVRMDKEFDNVGGFPRLPPG
jgi:hypothetical protein